MGKSTTYETKEMGEIVCKQYAMEEGETTTVVQRQRDYCGNEGSMVYVGCWI